MNSKVSKVDLDLTIMIWSQPKWNGHDQNELVRSKLWFSTKMNLIWTWPIHLGHDHFILVVTKSLWSSPNQFDQTKTILDWPKLFWSHRRTRHKYYKNWKPKISCLGHQGIQKRLAFLVDKVKSNYPKECSHVHYLCSYKKGQYLCIWCICPCMQSFLKLEKICTCFWNSEGILGIWNGRWKIQCSEKDSICRLFNFPFFPECHIVRNVMEAIKK